MQSHSKKYYKYQKKVIHLGSNTIHMPELVEFLKRNLNLKITIFFYLAKALKKKLKVI